MFVLAAKTSLTAKSMKQKFAVLCLFHVRALYSELKDLKINMNKSEVHLLVIWLVNLL